MRQTLSNMEIIVVDDGSTDESGKIIDAYANRFKQIIPVHKKNGGVGSAYQTGLEKARGEYVGFLDSDDWVEKGMYLTLWDKASQTQADVVKSNSYWVGRKRKKKVCIPVHLCNQIIRDKFKVPQFVWGHPCHWTAIYKKSFLNKYKIRMNKKVRDIAPDIDFLYRVWFYMRSLYLVPKAFVHYRIERPTSDRNSGAKMSFYLLNAHFLVRQFFIQKKVDAACWYIKTYSEFCHLKYELQHRCITRRKKFIYELSKLFWANLDEEHFITEPFPWKDLFLYHVIACFPFLYYLNDVTRFWITRPAVGGGVAKWRLFGLWRTECGLQENPKTKWYILGIRVH